MLKGFVYILQFPKCQPKMYNFGLILFQPAAYMGWTLGCLLVKYLSNRVIPGFSYLNGEFNE